MKKKFKQFFESKLLGYEDTFKGIGNNLISSAIVECGFDLTTAIYQHAEELDAIREKAAKAYFDTLCKEILKIKFGNTD